MDDFGRNAAALVNVSTQDNYLFGTNRDTIAAPFTSLGIDDSIQYLIPFRRTLVIFVCRNHASLDVVQVRFEIKLAGIKRGTVSRVLEETN